MRLVSNPRSTLRMFTKLLSSNVAATTQAVLTATSTATRVERRRAAGTPLADVAADDRSTSTGRSAVERNAGTIPIEMPVTTVTMNVNDNVFRFTAASSSRGKVA